MSEETKHTAGVMGITRGVANVDFSATNSADIECGERVVAQVMADNGSDYLSDEDECNAAFISEAFNVAHETGLTPRQLAERVKELERVMRIVEGTLPHMGGSERSTFSLLQDIRSALSKSEPKGGK